MFANRKSHYPLNSILDTLLTFPMHFRVTCHLVYAWHAVKVPPRGEAGRNTESLLKFFFFFNFQKYLQWTRCKTSWKGTLNTTVYKSALQKQTPRQTKSVKTHKKHIKKLLNNVGILRVCRTMAKVRGCTATSAIPQRPLRTILWA